VTATIASNKIDRRREAASLQAAKGKLAYVIALACGLPETFPSFFSLFSLVFALFQPCCIYRSGPFSYY
jgi:hypothetical protein